MVDLNKEKIEYHKRQMLHCPGETYADRQRWYNTLLLAGLHEKYNKKDIENLKKIICKLFETAAFKECLVNGDLDLEGLGFVVEYADGKIVVSHPTFDGVDIFTISSI